MDSEYWVLAMVYAWEVMKISATHTTLLLGLLAYWRSQLQALAVNLSRPFGQHWSNPHWLKAL